MGNHINNLQLNIDSNKLFATYSPVIETGFGRRQVGRQDIRQEMADASAADFLAYDSSILELIKAVNENRAYSVSIAERRDGSVAVEITPDKMEAYVTIQPPYGGSPVSREKVTAAVAAANIAFGLDEKIIKNIETDATAPMEYLIACGERPVHGVDGELVCLISAAQERKPRCDENGVCDLRDLGGIAMWRRERPSCGGSRRPQGRMGRMFAARWWSTSLARTSPSPPISPAPASPPTTRTSSLPPSPASQYLSPTAS